MSAPPLEGSLNGALIAFDLDGTLVDTATDLMGALNVVLGEAGLPPLPLASARMLVGRGARALLQRGFEAAGETLSPDDMPRLFTRFLAVYRDRIAEESRAFEGVETALTTLKSSGARLAVCTNKPTDLSVLLLEALNLAGYFDAIVGADATPTPKPDPRHLFAAIGQAGGDPARAILVGDSRTDFDTARAALVPIILVPFGYSETPIRNLTPDAFIEHFADLPAAAARLFSALPASAASVIGSPSRNGGPDA